MTYMRCDDDSFLSAYMDGQLNPDQQQLVESMLVARPQFADKLRDLTAVRDIVVGLNRDARVDVANDVMERIRRRARPRLPLANFRPWSSRTRKLAASAGMFAAVAGSRPRGQSELDRAQTDSSSRPGNRRLGRQSDYRFRIRLRRDR